RPRAGVPDGRNLRCTGRWGVADETWHDEAAGRVTATRALAHCQSAAFEALWQTHGSLPPHPSPLPRWGRGIFHAVAPSIFPTQNPEEPHFYPIASNTSLTSLSGSHPITAMESST